MRRFRSFYKRNRMVVFAIFFLTVSFFWYHYQFIQRVEYVQDHRLSMIDYCFLFFNGARYFSMGDTSFFWEIPYLWLMFYILSFYLLFKESRLAKEEIGIQKMIRLGSRKKWWQSQWKKGMIFLFFLYLILYLSFGMVGFFTSKGSYFSVNKVYLQAIEIPINYDRLVTTFLMKAILLPFFAHLALASLYLLMENIIRKNNVSYMLLLVSLIGSLFFSNPLFFMNYAMTIRTLDYQKLLIGDLFAMIWFIVWIIIPYIVGHYLLKTEEFLSE